MLIFDVTESNIPEWYSLGFDIASKTIIIRVPKTTWEEINEMFNQSTLVVDEIRKKLDLGKFVYPDHNQNQPCLPFREDYIFWGFDSTITSSTDFNGDKILQVGLPKSSQEDRFETEKIFSVSASLVVLFTLLSYCEIKSKSRQTQLLAIWGFILERGMYGASLSVYMSPAICKWMTKFSDNSNCIPVAEAMKAAWNYMSESKFDLSFDFRALYRKPHWINLTVPGNACGLDPSDYYEIPDKGYRMLPHNTDHPVQQLSLLAGVATLYQLARSDC